MNLTTIRFLFLALSCFWSYAVQAAQLEVEIRDGKVYIEAEDVSLISVLERFSEAAGLYLHSDVPLTRAASFSIQGRSVEETARRLLLNHSYLLAFRGARVSAISVLSSFDNPGEFGIIPAPSPRLTEQQSVPQPESEKSALQPRGIERYAGESIASDLRALAREEGINILDESTSDEERLLRESRRLARQLTAESATPFALNEVQEDSVFSRMGLRAGDRISSVNGDPVTSRAELVESLIGATGNNMIRLELVDEQGRMQDPLYVEIGEPETSSDGP